MENYIKPEDVQWLVSYGKIGLVATAVLGVVVFIAAAIFIGKIWFDLLRRKSQDLRPKENYERNTAQK